MKNDFRKGIGAYAGSTARLLPKRTDKDEPFELNNKISPQLGEAYKKFKTGRMKGQLTINNLFALFIAFIIYFVVVLPILNPIIAGAVATAQASPNSFTDIEVALFYAIPFLMCLMLVMTGMNYAIPQERRYG
jgi:hypothetical protein